MLNLIHVVPDTRTPNRDLGSLQRGIDWLKRRLHKTHTANAASALLQLIDPPDSHADAAPATRRQLDVLKRSQEQESNKKRLSEVQVGTRIVVAGKRESRRTQRENEVKTQRESHADAAPPTSRQRAALKRSQEQETRKKRLSQVQAGTRIVAAEKRKSRRTKRENEEKT